MAPRGKTLVFDLETQYLANEVGGWSNIDRMLFAAGVVYVVDEGVYRHFLEADVPELIAELQAAGRIIGYNLLRFDYSVLRPYGLIVDHAMRQKSMDLMLEQDVRVTYKIYDFGMQHGYVQIRERSGRLRRVPVPWGAI